MADLTVDDVHAAPGTRAHGYLKVAEHLDGSPATLPMLVVNGANAGPTLWITGCEHGDETLAAATIIEFMSGLDPSEISGQVVALPVLNSTAFNMRRRFSLLDSMDLSRAYPGFKNGWLAQQITARVSELMVDSADYVINVHGGIPGLLDLTPYCIATYVDSRQWDEELKDFVESFLFDKIARYTGRSTERGQRTATMQNLLLERGIPNFVPEVGPDTRGGLRTGIRGFANAMRFLKMLPGDSIKLERYHYFADIIHIFPTRGGVFTSYVALDEVVKEGQRLASIRNFSGEVTEELVSPTDGVILVVWTNAVIGSGDFCAYEIATFDGFNRPWPGSR